MDSTSPPPPEDRPTPPTDELEALRSEVAELRRLVAGLTRSGAAHPPAGAASVAPEPTTAPQVQRAGDVSRRGLLRALPAAAAAGVVAAAGGSLLSAQPAAAADGSPLLLGVQNDSGQHTTSLKAGQPGASSPDVLLIGEDNGHEYDNSLYTTINPDGVTIVDKNDGTGRLSVHNTVYPYGYEAFFAVGMAEQTLPVPGFVRVSGARSNGRIDEGDNALVVQAHGAAAVTALVTSADDFGDHGYNTPGTAVHATAANDSAGVLVDAVDGRGLQVTATGTATSTDTVVVANAGLGRALVATSSHSSNAVGTVTGISNGTSAGVWGATTGSNSGPAVVG